jgi:hypothetical protein
MREFFSFTGTSKCPFNMFLLHEFSERAAETAAAQAVVMASRSVFSSHLSRPGAGLSCVREPAGKAISRKIFQQKECGRKRQGQVDNRCRHSQLAYKKHPDASRD